MLFIYEGKISLLDIFERPDFVHDFFLVICEVMIRLSRMVQERQRKSGFYVNQFSVSNCVVNMISPQMYREFIFPHDRRIALSFERFGVHTCNWNITPYVEILKDLPNLAYDDLPAASPLQKSSYPGPSDPFLHFQPKKSQPVCNESSRLELLVR